MQDPHLDLFSVFSMILAVSVGPQVAPALAAYIVIFLGAIVGTLPALKMREPSDKPTSAILFVTVLTVWSVGITFGASLLIQKHSGVGWQWLLFPVSFGISALGERWLEAPAIAWRFGKRAFFAMLPKGGQE